MIEITLLIPPYPEERLLSLIQLFVKFFVKLINLLLE